MIPKKPEPSPQTPDSALRPRQSNTWMNLPTVMLDLTFPKNRKSYSQTSQTITSQQHNAEFLLLPFTFLEYNEVIHNKKNTAPGPDHISYHLLRQLFSSSHAILQNILNRVRLHSVVPPEWLHVQIAPIPMKEPNSFRPIALTSCIRKIIESIIGSRISYWLEQNSLILPNIFGFRH